MAAAEGDLVIKCIHKPSCIMLCQSIEEGRMTVVDPDDDIPTGHEVLSQLPPQKPAIHEHCITLC